SLKITATSANKFTIHIESLDGITNPGPAAHFDSSQSYTWRILTTSKGITGFSRDVINIDTSAFSNSLGNGRFVVDLSTYSLDVLLRFIPNLPFANSP